MARVTLSRLNTLPDVISTEAFELVLGDFPGLTSSAEDFILKCQNANYPGKSNEKYDVPLHGHVMSYRGRIMYPRTLAVTYVEDKDFNTTRSLRNWHNFIVDPETFNSSGNKSDYTINPDLRVYNAVGELIDTVTFYKLFPNDYPDVQVTGESSTAWLVTATFSYDYYLSSGENTG